MVTRRKKPAGDDTYSNVRMRHGGWDIDLPDAVEARALRAGTSYAFDSFRDAAFVIVEEGFAVIRRAATARRGVVICHAGAGALLAAPGPGEKLEALGDARIMLVSEAAYQALLARPHTATVVSDALRATLRQKQESIAIFGSIRPVERVERKLLQLAREYGRVAADGIRVDFPITHELLAEMIGSARETVSRAIDSLESSGLVARDGRSYRLKVRPETIAT